MDIGTFGAKLNVEKIIRKLVELERQPLYRLKAEIEYQKELKKAWQELAKRLYALDRSCKKLYGIENPFEAKSVESSDPSLVQGTANKYAEEGTISVRVIRLAKKHRFTTDSISQDTVLPKGKIKIRVGKKERIIDFDGGDIRKLKRLIDRKAKGLVNASLIKDTDTTYIISFESLKTGKGGEVLLEDLEGDLLVSVGVFKKVSNKDLSSGKKLHYQQVDKYKYKITTSYKIKEGDILKIDFVVYNIYSNVPRENRDEPIENIEIAGFDLHGYGLSRKLDVPLEAKKMKVSLGIGAETQVFEADISDRSIKYNIPSKYDGSSISSISFSLPEGYSLSIKDILISNEREERLSRFKHLISKPTDAIFEIDGVRISRPYNKNINDVIKGVSLSLLGEDKSKVVELTIRYDYKKALEDIKEWVKDYNDVMDYINQNLKISEEVRKTRVNRIRTYEDYLNEKRKSGYFVQDMVAVDLKNMLFNTVISYYPNSQNPPFHTIYDIGINTGGRYTWRENKGKLSIDEYKLKNVLSKYPLSVKELFGSDTNGDFRIDNGLAFKMRMKLKAYTTKAQRGLIKSRIAMIDQRIKTLKDRFYALEDRVRRYEDRLKAEFSRMQRAVEINKNMSRWLQNQLNKLGNQK